jgi:formylglycine-generating enzyme required for sulfatase activity
LGDGTFPFPWGSDGLTVEQRANFGLAGPVTVGSMRLGVSPFGAHDMAGNVREWLASVADPRRRTVVGGSWQDPTYMFEPQHAETFDPAYASPAIGFRVARAPRVN